MANREIMYIGNKPTKTDNANNIPARIWRGLGDVLAVPEFEANKLTIFEPPIWRDVTELKKEDRAALIANLQEEQRQAERKQAELNKSVTNPKLLSDDELYGELERRRKLKGVPERTEIEPQGAGPSGKRPSQESQDGPRPQSTDQLLNDIIKAISLLQREDRTHYDSEGRPSVEVVRGLVGYRVSQSELDAAVRQIKSATE